MGVEGYLSPKEFEARKRADERRRLQSKRALQREITHLARRTAVKLRATARRPDCVVETAKRFRGKTAAWYLGSYVGPMTQSNYAHLAATYHAAVSKRGRLYMSHNGVGARREFRPYHSCPVTEELRDLLLRGLTG
jgi:hypothetical protein